MNKVFLIGNLTRDPELTETSSGVKVCHFAVAVNRSYTDSNGERQTDFFNFTVWRSLAESVAQYCKKGNKVAVCGSVQIRNYEDRENVKRTAVEVVVSDVEFLSPKPAGGGEDPQPKPKLESFDDDGSIPF